MGASINKHCYAGGELLEIHAVPVNVVHGLLQSPSPPARLLAEMSGTRREWPKRYRLFVESGLVESDEGFQSGIEDVTAPHRQ